jgi:hypothetical protein
MNRLLAALLALGLLTSVPALADDDDDDRYGGRQELSHSARALMGRGFTHTRSVKRDGGELEFKGVRHRNGRTYDVKTKNGRIVEIDED